MILKRVGNKEDLIIRSLCDASYFATESAVQGEILLLANTKTDAVSPLLWKSRTIANTCTSSKEAETRACLTCVSDSIYSAERIETMLFGHYDKRVKVEIHTDSEPLIVSIASTKRIDNKSLCNVVGKMMEELLDEKLSCYAYML